MTTKPVTETMTTIYILPPREVLDDMRMAA